MKMRYTVYDTERREYLRVILRPTDDPGNIVTKWTKSEEDAAHFPGIKSAEAVVRVLGSYSQFVVKNAKGEIVA